MIHDLPTLMKPTKWSDYIGSQDIVRQIKDSIKERTFAAGYFITGDTGVGKSTLANLIVKTIKCDNIDKELNPCGECLSCKMDHKSKRGERDGVRWIQKGQSDSLTTQFNEVTKYVWGCAPLPTGELRDYTIVVVEEVWSIDQKKLSEFLQLLEGIRVLEEKQIFFILCTMNEDQMQARSPQVYNALKGRCNHFEILPHSVRVLKKYLQTHFKHLEAEAAELIALQARGSLREVLRLYEQVEKKYSSVTPSEVASTLHLLTKKERKILWELIEKATITYSGYKYFISLKTYWEKLTTITKGRDIIRQLDKDLDWALYCAALGKGEIKEHLLFTRELFYNYLSRGDGGILTAWDCLKQLQGKKIFDYNILDDIEEVENKFADLYT